MSDQYPTDMGKVAQKLATHIADLQYQLSQMEVIAETFRDERDAARAELSHGSEPEAEVYDITDLPEG